MSAAADRQVPLMSAEMRDAAIAEVLGDVHTMHKSVKDLARIVVDTDERISTRVFELREISKEFAAQREAAFAGISIRSREVSQRAFKEEMGTLLHRLEALLVEVPRTVADVARKRVAELMMIALASGALSCFGTLAGIWMMRH